MTTRRRAAIAVVATIVSLSVAATVALGLGWHPIPSTAVGCSLHKGLSSFSGAPAVRSENLELVTDCLNVTVLGREATIRDAQTVAAVRAWLDARSNLWSENFLQAPDQDSPLIVIHPCNRPPDTSETDVYLNEDWIGFNPGKRLQRPICRGEWREMASILASARP